MGDIVLVKSGEKIPIDGKIKEGRGEINQAPITGESVLITKEPGDEVFGGTLNQLGVIKIEVTRVVTETHLIQNHRAREPGPGCKTPHGANS